MGQLERSLKIGSLVTRGHGFQQLFGQMFRLYCHIGRSPRAPQFLNFVGGEQFEDLGHGHFENVRSIADAKPDDRILDVGCGVGRVALHFAEYMDGRGHYDGFDTVTVGVDWCNARIARAHPNFKFVHADVYNQQYNPEGLLDAASFNFPYKSVKFSLVFATSVLTHMFPDAACQYLREISRVLEPGGRSVVTFFIINDESRRHMMSSGLCFEPTEGGYWTTQPDNPEAAVAFEEEKVLTMYEQAGLEIQTPIRYGRWSGRDGLVGGQDHVLAIKR